MTFLEKIKTLLGIDGSSSDAEDRDVGVTVEREGSAPESDGGTAPAETGSTGTGADGSTTSERAVEVDPQTDESDDEHRVPSEAVDVIKGIGPTYADRLSNAGIETVADLAEAEVGDVADRADVPEGRLEEWIERAKNRST